MGHRLIVVVLKLKRHRNNYARREEEVICGGRGQGWLGGVGASKKRLIINQSNTHTKGEFRHH